MRGVAKRDENALFACDRFFKTVSAGHILRVIELKICTHVTGDHWDGAKGVEELLAPANMFRHYMCKWNENFRTHSTLKVLEKNGAGHMGAYDHHTFSLFGFLYDQAENLHTFLVAKAGDFWNKFWTAKGPRENSGVIFVILHSSEQQFIK